MERFLKGRTAVVTGAGVRVGRAIAEGLGRYGADVIVHFATSANGAADACEAIKASGSRALAVQADLTKSKDVARVFAAADDLGGCDLLINSAAIFERKPLREIDDIAWSRMLDTNLTAPFYCCRSAVQTMLSKGRGDIVNIVDVGGGLLAWRDYSHYCSAKAGLAMLTRCLALELAPTIRVNAIAPGPISFPTGYTTEQKEHALSRVPLGHLGSSGDILETIAYLLRAGFVTGQMIAVDGGRAIA